MALRNIGSKIWGHLDKFFVFLEERILQVKKNPTAVPKTRTENVFKE